MKSKSADSQPKIGVDVVKPPSREQSDAYGIEGTNKTVPEPQPGARAVDELQGTPSKFIEKTPYTRG